MSLFDFVDLGLGLSKGINDARNIIKIKEQMNGNDYRVFQTLIDLGKPYSIEFAVGTDPARLMSTRRRKGLDYREFQTFVVMEPAFGLIHFLYVPPKSKRLFNDSDTGEQINWVNTWLPVGRMVMLDRNTDFADRDLLQTALKITLPYQPFLDNPGKVLTALFQEIINFSDLYDAYFELGMTGKIKVQNDGSLGGDQAGRFLASYKQTHQQITQPLAADLKAYHQHSFEMYLLGRQIPYIVAEYGIAFTTPGGYQSYAYFYPDGHTVVETYRQDINPQNLWIMAGSHYVGFLNTYVANLGNFIVDRGRKILIFRIGLPTKGLDKPIPDSVFAEMINEIDHSAWHLNDIQIAGEYIPHKQTPNAIQKPGFEDILLRVCSNLMLDAEGLPDESKRPIADSFYYLAHSFKEKFNLE